MIRPPAFALIAAGLFLIASQAHCQQLVHRIGFLANIKDPERMQAWEQGLRERGYVVGRNLDVEYRFFHGQTDRIPALLAELVALNPELIVTTTSNSAVVIHALAPTIPMVFLTVADPVALGLVKSLARPGGNVTGLATLDPKAFIAKQLEILKQLDPQASRIAVLMNPTYQMHQLALPKLPEAARVLQKPITPAREHAHEKDIGHRASSGPAELAARRDGQGSLPSHARSPRRRRAGD